MSVLWRAESSSIERQNILCGLLCTGNATLRQQLLIFTQSFDNQAGTNSGW